MIKCVNCNHLLTLVRNRKGIVDRHFNGMLLHKNGLQKWAVICRVKNCGCLEPMPDVEHKSRVKS